MATPAVSVVIPTANRPDLLRQAIASVRAQSFQDFEIIIVDDGESVRDAVSSLGDSRIRYFKNPSKKGGGGSRNIGIREAQGEFIAFLDDDDEWLPEKLKTQLAAFSAASPYAFFCFSAVTDVYDNREETAHVPAGEANYLERALRRFSGFLTSSLVVKKAGLTETGGFDESLPSHQEPDLVIRLSQKYDGIGVDEPLVRMNMSRSYEHIGSSLQRRIAGRMALLKKHEDLFASRPRVLAKHYFRLGLWSRDSGERRAARGFFWKAFQLSGNPRYVLHALVTLFPGVGLV